MSPNMYLFDGHAAELAFSRDVNDHAEEKNGKIVPFDTYTKKQQQQKNHVGNFIKITLNNVLHTLSYC